VNTGDNSGSGFCRLFGSYEPFDDATLAALYPTHGSYVAAVNDATRENLKDGFVTKEDARETRREAADSDIGGG
jgi:hypothetical protein